jgi:hypothetical protein
MRVANAATSENTELMERKWLTKLLYQPTKKAEGITKSQVKQVARQYPIIGILYDIVQSFNSGKNPILFDN